MTAAAWSAGTLRAGLAGRTKVWVGRMAVPLIVLGGWAAAATATDEVAKPGPTFSTVVQGIEGGWISSALWSTAKAVLLGFAAATALGLAVGLVLSLRPFAGKVFEPVLTAFFSIPRIIVYPAILAIFGIGGLSKTIVACLAAVFPIALSTIDGARAVSATLIKLGRSTGASMPQLLRKIYLPAALPTIMTGIRLGFGVAFITVIVAELFAAASGIGLLLGQAYAFNQDARVFALVLVIAVVAVVVNFLLWSLERRVRAVVD